MSQLLQSAKRCMASLQQCNKRANVVGEEFGLLGSCKMTAAWEFLPPDHVVTALDINSRRNGKFARKMRNGRRDRDSLVLIETQGCAATFPVQANSGGHRLGKPVDRDRGQELCLRESTFNVAVAIAPGPEFIDNPCGQPDRRVVQGRSESIGFRSLYVCVSPFGIRPLAPMNEVFRLFARELL